MGFYIKSRLKSSYNEFFATGLEVLDTEIFVVVSLLLSPLHSIVKLISSGLSGEALFKIYNHAMDGIEVWSTDNQKATNAYIIMSFPSPTSPYPDATIIVWIKYRATTVEPFWCYHTDIPTSTSVSWECIHMLTINHVVNPLRKEVTFYQFYHLKGKHTTLVWRAIHTCCGESSKSYKCKTWSCPSHIYHSCC